MLKPYIIYFKFKQPADKKAGAVKQFRLFATNADEARLLATQYGAYPNMEVLRILPA